ncbi:hypothetical protein ACHAWF_007681 [Thalassiosira exigua]
MKYFTTIALVALTASAKANNPSDYNSFDDYGDITNQFDNTSNDYAVYDADSTGEFAFDEYDLGEDEAEGSFVLEDIALGGQQRGETLRSCLDNCNRLQRRSNDLTAREQCQRDCHLRFAPSPSPQPAKCTRTRNGRETFFRSGRRFDLQLVRTHAQCTDRSNNLYQWGQFNGVQTFEDCASRCVNRPSSSVATSSSFRGIDFDCDAQQCRCLYDRGFLNTRGNRRRFTRTNRRERGSGHVAGGRTNNRNFFLCGRITSRRTRADESMVEFVDVAAGDFCSRFTRQRACERRRICAFENGACVRSGGDDSTLSSVKTQ